MNQFLQYCHESIQINGAQSFLKNSNRWWQNNIVGCVHYKVVILTYLLTLSKCYFFTRRTPIGIVFLVVYLTYSLYGCVILSVTVAPTLWVDTIRVVFRNDRLHESSYAMYVRLTGCLLLENRRRLCYWLEMSAVGYSPYYQLTECLWNSDAKTFRTRWHFMNAELYIFAGDWTMECAKSVLDSHDWTSGVHSARAI